MSLLQPSEEFTAEVSANTQCIIIRVKDDNLRSNYHGARHDASGVHDILRRFIFESFFFQGHDHAVNSVAELAAKLENRAPPTKEPVSGTPLFQNALEDRRLCKALQLMNENLGCDLDFGRIASDSGMSLRNLYNLMNRFTGLTPYQYVLSRRLIKARELIIDTDWENGNPGVSTKATEAGFRHAGRFSKYYRRHFGENPTETVKQLRQLKTSARNVQAAFSDHMPGSTWITTRCASLRKASDPTC